MLNHFRTLLMNVSGSPVDANVPGEELMPLDYAQVSLPGSLLAARRVLFGATPDRAMLNYRARQLLAVVQATELAEFATLLDPRVTYDVTDDGSMAMQFGSALQQVAGAAAELTISGQEDPPDFSGRMQKTWLLTVVSSSLATVLHEGLVTNANYTDTNDLSSAVPLPDSGLYAQFQPRVGASWRIQNISRPQASLGDVLATLRELPQEQLLTIFMRDRAEGSAEPMLTFYNLWMQHRDFSHQLGGLLCALVYHTETLRQ